jgi:hypothetical protein
MDAVTTAIELAGAGAVITGLALWWLPAALIVGGLMLLALGYLLDAGRPVVVE